MRLTLLLLCCAAGPALAQVTTNDSALQGLQATPAPAAPAPKPILPPAPSTATVKPLTAAQPARHGAAAHAPAKPAKLPAVPLAPPPNLVLAPPPPNLPEHKRVPPPPVPIKPDAPGTVTDIAGGSRITFGPGSADLNPAMNDALQALAARAKADPTLDITITAYAPGTAEDPSTPRRLSLDRALAARAMLINAGIASERIHAVARGFTGIEAGPPDRMDMVAAAPHAAPPGKPVPLPTPPPKPAKAPP
jgi:outer membrane protein OmpA-like peptidoglycan-associated protein